MCRVLAVLLLLRDGRLSAFLQLQVQVATFSTTRYLRVNRGLKQHRPGFFAACFWHYIVTPFILCIFLPRDKGLKGGEEANAAHGQGGTNTSYPLATPPRRSVRLTHRYRRQTLPLPLLPPSSLQYAKPLALTKAESSSTHAWGKRCVRWFAHTDRCEGGR